MRRPVLFSRETFWFGFWLLGAALVVICYNTWSVCCGACSLDAVLTLGLHGWILLLANTAALVMLILLKLLNSRALKPVCCSGRPRGEGWRFCPQCGKELL